MPAANDGQQAEETNERFIAQGLPMKNKAPVPSPRPSTPTTDPSLRLSKADIATRAEALWRQSGCPEGRDDEFWLEAERQLRRGSGPTGKGMSGVLSDPDANSESLAEEVDDRFPDDTGKEPTSL
jgi:Protein of unknown function (DUF2934)